MPRMYCTQCDLRFELPPSGISRCPVCRDWHTHRIVEPTQAQAGLTLTSSTGVTEIKSPAQLLRLVFGDATAETLLAHSEEFKEACPECGARVEEGPCPNC